MKVLVTGASGFIGRNLCAELRLRGGYEVCEVNRETTSDLFSRYCLNADIIFHLAGVNRLENPNEFMDGNYGSTERLLDTLKKHENTCPIVFSSSIHATSDTPYGLSKRACEDLLLSYAKETGARVLIYRLPNVFGKWSKPNYNSAVATFCHNIGRGLPIHINDEATEITLMYIDDLIREFTKIVEDTSIRIGHFQEVTPIYRVLLVDLVDMIYSFQSSRGALTVPDTSDAFTKKLHSTYLSFLPEDSFNYPLKMNLDERGSFTEFIRTADRGQFSVNVSKPGICKGNHWHHTKVEKFLVVSGKGVIRLRKIDSEEIYEYFVNGETLEVVDIPPGYTHNIENLGNDDMVTIMWANELFDPDKPDTYYSLV